MQLHGNARTTPYIRREMVRRVRERAEPVTETAAALGVSARTVYKWLDRYEREGEAGLLDRSSRPTCCPHATSAGVVRQIDKLRRRRLTAWQISRRLAVPRSTVSAWLKRLGLAKLDALEPKPEIVRYEYEHPGDLLHLDTKKLARIRRPGHRIHGDRSKRAYGVGWENAHGRYRRSLSGGVRRSAARRRPTHLHSVPAASRRALRFDGSSGAPSDDRQRA